MSYCRNNGINSDVYVIATKNGEKEVWECVGCTLTERRYGKTLDTRSKMLTHLEHHRVLGDKVPICATSRLQREIQEMLSNDIE